MLPEEKKALENLVGTSQAKVLCAYINEIKERIKSEMFTLEDISLEELKGRKIAIGYFDRIIMKLSTEKKDKKKNEYL